MEFMTAINDWETRRHSRSRLDAGKQVSRSDLRQLDDASIAQLEDQLMEIRAKYLSLEARSEDSYRGFSKGGIYAGINAASVVAVTSLSPALIEIRITGGLITKSSYRFRLKADGAGWLIDSALSKTADGEWGRHYL